MISREMLKLVFLVAVAILPPSLLWYGSTGNPLLYMNTDVPPGQLLYVLSKLFGLIALMLFIVQLAIMVLRIRVPRLILRHWSLNAHQLLGVLVVCTVLFHVGLFVSAASVRSGHFASHPLKLNFFSGFYDQMVSLGVLSLILLVLVAVMGKMISRKQKLKIVHRSLALMCAALVLVHSYAIGSETGTFGMTLFYGTMAVAFIASMYILSRRISG